MGTGEHEDGCQFVDILDHFAEEILADDHSHAFEILVGMYAAYNLFTTDDAEVVGTRHVVFCVANIFR